MHYFQNPYSQITHLYGYPNNRTPSAANPHYATMYLHHTSPIFFSSISSNRVKVTVMIEKTLLNILPTQHFPSHTSHKRLNLFLLHLANFKLNKKSLGFHQIMEKNPLKSQMIPCRTLRNPFLVKISFWFGISKILCSKKNDVYF